MAESARDRFMKRGGEQVSGASIEYWNPEDKGKNILEGKYVELESEHGQYKKPLYVIETADGDRIGVNATAVLERSFKAIPIGSEVFIEFTGIEKTKKGQYAKMFEVLAIPPEGEEITKSKAVRDDEEDDEDSDEDDDDGSGVNQAELKKLILKATQVIEDEGGISTAEEILKLMHKWAKNEVIKEEYYQAVLDKFNPNTG